MMCGATVEYPQSTPSISARVSPASAIASSAALLMRSRDDEPSCLPNAVSPTPVRELMSTRLHLISSFPDRPKDQHSDVRLHIGESPDSGFASSMLPGFT